MTDLDCMVVIVVDTPPNNMSTTIVGPKAADEEYNSAIMRAMSAAISKNADNQALAAVTAEPRATIAAHDIAKSPVRHLYVPAANHNRATTMEQKRFEREREMEGLRSPPP